MREGGVKNPEKLPTLFMNGPLKLGLGTTNQTETLPED